MILGIYEEENVMKLNERMNLDLNKIIIQNSNKVPYLQLSVKDCWLKIEVTKKNLYLMGKTINAV